jgi:hypothetical protein
MTTTLHFDERRTTGTPGVGVNAAASNIAPQLAGRHVPATMSIDDTLFWSLKWQAETRQSERARAEGRSVVFDSADPLDVVRGLFSE